MHLVFLKIKFKQMNLFIEHGLGETGIRWGFMAQLGKSALFKLGNIRSKYVSFCFLDQWSMSCIMITMVTMDLILSRFIERDYYALQNFQAVLVLSDDIRLPCSLHICKGQIAKERTRLRQTDT